MQARGPRSVQLVLERLEERALPAATPWQLETFENLGAVLTPPSWAGWKSSSSGDFQIAAGTGLGSETAYVSNAGSGDAARSWMTTPFGADVQVRAAVLVNSLIPGQVFVRGQNVNTAQPNYYAVSVTRGLDVQLLRAVNGVTTVLGNVKSSSWFSGQWVQVTLTAKGDQLQAQVFRTDTAQYLNVDGTWQITPAAAIVRTDAALTRGGLVGVGRAAQVAGKLAMDNFQVTTSLPEADSVALHEENFSTAASGGLPPGWALWRNDSSSPVQIVAGTQALTGSAALSINGNIGSIARAWYDTALPANVQASTTLYLDSLVPAQLFVRGQNLNTDKPSYYAVSITRGMQVQLLRVVNGQSTALATINSSAWLSNQWVQVSLEASGSDLRVRVYRTDTAQYLTANGTWQVTPAWAIEKSDTAIAGAGKAGLARASTYAGSIIFDGFLVTTTANAPAGGDAIDKASTGTLPTGWSQWNNAANGFLAATGGLGGTNALVSDGTSATVARAWLSSIAPANAEIQGSVYLGGLAPTQIFLRGSNVNVGTPSYYAVSITRGLQAQLLRVSNGVTATLSTVNSADYLSSQWVEVTLRAVGDRLQVQVVRTDTGEYLATDRTWKRFPVYAIDVRDTAITAGGFAGVNRPAAYAGKVMLDDITVSPIVESASIPPPVAPLPTPLAPAPTPTSSSAPSVPQHYSHIRIAQLAYIGTPFGTFEQKLLKESVDLVVPNTTYLNQLETLAPATPKLIYSNVSNVYEGLLADYLRYADANGYKREGAFYHVSGPTPFSGDSASSRPVNWFWSVQRGNDAAGWTDMTRAARVNTDQIAFASTGQSTVFGYTERFREINFVLKQAAGVGWSALIEYPTAVDAAGKPTAWATLPVLKNTTNSLRTSGQVLFDPPANWVAASINGSDRLYFIRFRTTSSGTAPIGSSVLGRDYVNARGVSSGIIPAFDYAADKDGDGYLKDSEYAARKAGFDARFEYESRMFYPAYGQMRFATNPSNAGFRAWAVDYSFRYLSAQPKADGLFVDNSFGRLSFDAGTPRESLATYSQDYGTLLAAIQTRIAPRWVLANTAGGGVSVDSVVSGGVSYLEEFALRPLAHNHTQFEDVAALVQRRLTLAGGKGYAILDTYPQGGSPTDPRTQIAQLAYYYLLANPSTTFLMFNGGYEPATSWTRHWTEAVKYNVGQPKGTWSVFATGQDPSNTTLAYKVYQRTYDNALMLYKPLSYTLGKGTGTLLDSTGTTHILNGTYRPLLADGTLGAAVTSIRLRNGEGAVLIKV